MAGQLCRHTALSGRETLLERLFGAAKAGNRFVGNSGI